LGEFSHATFVIQYPKHSKNDSLVVVVFINLPPSTNPLIPHICMANRLSIEEAGVP
jgi:hypothetical protein